MWTVTNHTPYAADGSWVQDKDANKLWLVVVKATFEVLPDGRTILAREQVPVSSTPQYEGEASKSSLAYEGDFFGPKTATDVLVRGCAWSITPVSFVDAQIKVGPVNKTLRVFGDRVWRRNFMGALAISDPELFRSMPITYERAYGGWDRTAANQSDHRLDARNPVGTGFAIRAAHCEGLRVPNVEDPRRLLTSWSDKPGPAGFNAIECHWSPRRELAGTYDDGWRATRFPLWAEDFDPLYHNCAPADQQVPGFLRGGERVELVNLSPQGTLVLTLPKVYLRCRTLFGDESIEHRCSLVSVVLEPDTPRLIMTWQSSLTCNHNTDYLDETLVMEKRVL